MAIKIDKQILFNITILIIVSILIYLYFQNNKESFEGIAGTSFVSRVPKGTIVAYYPSNYQPNQVITPPAGWALCNGENGTPDLRGRFIRMTSDGLTEMSNEKGYAFDNVNVSNNDTKIFSGVSKSNNVSSVIGLYKFGEKGGSDKIKLDEAAQLPPHTHGISGIDDCGSNCPNTWNLNRGYANSTQTKSTGSSEYVPNVPPFYTLVYIIKL